MTPRGFTDAERARIRERLLEIGREHFARFGYRKANVADIARAAGIAKGSLYLFFDSKAELFVETLLVVEAEMRARLWEEMRKPFPTPRDRLRRFLRFQFEVLRDHPLLALLTQPDEAAALLRENPAERLEELRADDEAFYRELVEEWRREAAIAPVEPEVVAALPRAILAMSLHRDLIGAGAFPGTLDLVIESLSAALAPGGVSN